MADQTTPASSETPATIPIGQAPDLATFRQARSDGKTEIPNPAVKADPVDDGPDLEVEGNPELKAAIDEAEAPKPEESPQEKAARTRRHKEAAKKSITTRFANQRDAARRERDEARAELDEWRTGKRAPQAVTQPTVKAGEAEPTFKAWAAANPYTAEKYGTDHPDPYGEWMSEFHKTHRAWEKTQEEAAAAQSRQAQQAEQANRDFQSRFHASASETRKGTPDYDAVVDPFLSAHQGQAHEPALMFALSRAADPAAFLYHLAKTPGAMDRFIGAARQGRDAVLEEAAVIRSTMAARASAPASPPEIKTPHEPHKPAGAGGSAHTSFDVKADTGSVADWRKHRDVVVSRR